jgi:hypothetical protein
MMAFDKERWPVISSGGHLFRSLAIESGGIGNE